MLQQFGADVDAWLDSAAGGAVLPDLIPIFVRLLNASASVAAINDELKKLNADPCYVGRWHHRQLPLLSSHRWTLSIAVLERTPQLIHSSPRPQLRALLNDADVTHQRFALPDSYRNDCFVPGLRLHRLESGPLRPRHCIAMGPGSIVDDFVVSQPAVFLQLSLSCRETVEWLFSRQHLAAERANDADIETTQQRVAAYVLGQLGDARSLPALQQLCIHPHHAVRWAAIEALARLRPEQALSALQAAAGDPHPHIRAAARASLQRSSGGATAGTEPSTND